MKIHVLSASLKVNSGFSVVARHLATGLRDLGHDINVSGIQTVYGTEYSYGFEVMPIQTLYIDDTTQFALNIQRTNPDVVINIFQADSNFNNFSKVFSKTIWYTLVEGNSIPMQMEADLKQVIANGGKIVVPCKYGQNELKLAGIESKCIYYGINEKILRPLKFREHKPKSSVNGDIAYCFYATEIGQTQADPKLLHKQGCYECKEKCGSTGNKDCQHFQEEVVTILKSIDGKWIEQNVPITKLPSELMSKFVFGFVGQNLGVRKRIERLLKAYAILINDSKKLKDRTTLHLHTMPIALDGINLIKVINNLNLQNNVTFSYGRFRSSAWSEEAIAILYNSFDTMVSASSTEGFNLPTLESMACGTPVIAPNCSAFTELIGDSKEKQRGLLAEISEWQMIQDSSYRALVSETDLSENMKLMVTNRDKREELSKNAAEFARNYTWDRTYKEWNKFLESV